MGCLGSEAVLLGLPRLGWQWCTVSMTTSGLRQLGQTQAFKGGLVPCGSPSVGSSLLGFFKPGEGRREGSGDGVGLSVRKCHAYFPLCPGPREYFLEAPVSRVSGE